jgi:hypothetical protein
MTPRELEALVNDCVAEWFGRMQMTGEIPSDRTEAVEQAQAETQTRIFQALQKNAQVFHQLLASDQEHARSAVNSFIDAISAA